ncbi:G-protein coupled receptor GRL101-like isoform X2 [Babylonia areolata]
METPKPPAIIHFDGYGSFEVRPITINTNRSDSSDTYICPETHFFCPGNLTYCVPVFVRCNGVYDCPGREDEEGCDRYQCPGFYRCRASTICVHANHTCDGVLHCPQHDDELFCNITCPQNCTCQGLAFYCYGQFPAEQYQELRFLHAPNSGLAPENLKLNSMLIYLNLAKSKIKHFENVQFINLRTLDLSDNELSSLSTTQMNTMKNLQTLSLAGNPLVFLSNSDYDFQFLSFSSVRTLDLSNTIISELNITAFLKCPKLTFLNLTGCGVKRIVGEGFRSLTLLRHLDLRRCPVKEYPTDIFEGLGDLREVWADNYKLCCPATFPQGFYVTKCHSPTDEISSCDALLRSNFYRIILSVFAALALIGNLGSFVYRTLINRESSNLGFAVFVTHLCISDFLMGVYLAVIGIADRIYQGDYLWKDEIWKRSAGCKVAGFLSLLSSEVSALIICLITLDRFLVIRFPFRNIHFKKTSAHIACALIWLLGIVLAGIPLLPVTEHWNFYSQNGICIPLPITRNDFAGHDYSFSVMIIVNFILFLLIAAGQIFIYWSIRTNSIAAEDSNKQSKDLTIARRLITIAVSDFLCWFPVGLLGLLASSGVPVPGEVNVVIAIIILPVNSAINPFLYTINSLLEKRRKAREKKIQKMIMSTIAGKYSETVISRLDDTHTRSEALHMIKKWMSQKVISLQNLEQIVRNAQENMENLENETEKGL